MPGPAARFAAMWAAVHTAAAFHTLMHDSCKLQLGMPFIPVWGGGPLGRRPAMHAAASPALNHPACACGCTRCKCLRVPSDTACGMPKSRALKGPNPWHASMLTQKALAHALTSLPLRAGL